MPVTPSTSPPPSSSRRVGAPSSSRPSRGSRRPRERRKPTPSPRSSTTTGTSPWWSTERTAPPGTTVIEADLTVAPFLTALTTLQVLPPPGHTGGCERGSRPTRWRPATRPTSGDSDVYTVFTVETNPVYAEQPVEISSPQLESRCVRGWRFEPGSGAHRRPDLGHVGGLRASWTTTATPPSCSRVSSCAAGPSAVIADVDGREPSHLRDHLHGGPPRR